MKGNLKWTTVGLVVSFAAWLAGACAHVASKAGPVHSVEVVVEEKGGKPHIPKPPAKVEAKLGDSIEWHFHNRSRGPIRLGISEFKRHSRATCTTPKRHDEHEVEEIDPKALAFVANPIEVGPGAEGVLTGRIKTKVVPRTYKYDILGNGKAILDPEVEIER